MIRPIQLLALILAISACQKETLVEKANRQGIFLIGNAAEPKSLDHQMVTGVPESKIIGGSTISYAGAYTTPFSTTVVTGRVIIDDIDEVGTSEL